MASEKTEGIVVRLVEFSETSLIVTMFTRSLGLVSAIAKGARRPKSTFEGALDLLALCNVVLIPKAGEVLDILTEAKLERRFRAGAKDLRRLYSGYYVAELIRELTDRGDPSPELFELLKATLVQIESTDDLSQILLCFELRLLKLLGHAPTMESCATCGQGLGQIDAPGPRVPFAPIAGGVICERCRPSSRGIVLLKQQSCDWIRQLLASDGMEGKFEAIPSGSLGELRGLMNQYMAHLCGGPLRLTEYLTLSS